MSRSRLDGLFHIGVRSGRTRAAAGERGGVRTPRPHVSIAPALTGLAVLLAVELGAGPGLYVSLLALVCLIGLCFRGYMRTLERPEPATVVETMACAAAAALVLAACTLRFPDIVSGQVPPDARALSITAFGLTVAAACSQVVVAALRAAVTSARRRVAQRAADRRLAQRLRRPADVV